MDFIMKLQFTLSGDLWVLNLGLVSTAVPEPDLSQQQNSGQHFLHRLHVVGAELKVAEGMHDALELLAIVASVVGVGGHCEGIAAARGGHLPQIAVALAALQHVLGQLALGRQVVEEVVEHVEVALTSIQAK